MASIKQTPDGTWRARITRKGFPRISQNFDTRAEAEAWAQDTERQIRLYGRPTTHAATMTLGEALRRYHAEVTPRKKGWKQETDRIKRWQKHPWAERDMARLLSSEVAEWRRQAEKKWAASTVRNEMNLLSHVYRTARSEWGMDYLVNPFEGVMRPKMPQGRDRRLQGDEEERLLAAAADMPGPLHDIIVFAIETAMRRSEIQTLRWEYITHGGKVARLPETKNGSGRAVPLSTRARSALPLQPQQTGPVFNRGPDYISHGFKEACRRAGIEGLRFHDLRHEATSRLFEKGLELMEVASITGHKSLVMLRRYTHLSAVGLADKLG